MSDEATRIAEMAAKESELRVSDIEDLAKAVQERLDEGWSSENALRWAYSVVDGFGQ